jgi:hypothetical protein
MMPDMNAMTTVVTPRRKQRVARRAKGGRPTSIDG